MTFPPDGVALTHILVVSDIGRSRTFFRDVLGATVCREYGGTSCVLQFAHAMTIRVPSCQDAYDELRSRGATLLTPPHDRGQEVRCFFRDPGRSYARDQRGPAGRVHRIVDTLIGRGDPVSTRSR